MNTDAKDDIFSLVEVHRGIPQAMPVDNKPATDNPAKPAERAKKRNRKFK